MDEQNKTEEVKTTSTNSTGSFLNFSDNPRGMLVFLVGAFIILGVIITFYINYRNVSETEDSSEVVQQESNFTPVAPNSVVYGYWRDNASHINSLDLNTGEIRGLGILPSNVKKVTITDSNRMVFINRTDIRDHGSEIAAYDSASGLTTTLVAAAQGFAIDDYVISPNKRYMALWEVSIPDGANLEAGRSRVYGVDLQNSQVKNLIYDENLPDTTFATYPLAITDSGEIYMDTFQPNAAAGWANGMYVSNITGTIKGPIDSMIAGTYGTQPRLSPDGRYMAFGGYNGSLGAGTANVGSPDGFRQAVLSPNTIEMLDTVTKERTSLEGISTENRYSEVRWDRSGKVIYSLVSRDSAQNGYYMYDLNTLSSQKLYDTGDVAQLDTYAVISTLDNGKYLGGQRDISASNLGNLGETYDYALSELGVYDEVDGSLTPLALNQGLVQYIDVQAAGYFSSAQIIGRAGMGRDRTGTDQLQLQTFVLKPTLEPARSTQQSSGRCRDVATAVCNQLLGTNYTGNAALGVSSRSDVGTQMGVSPEFADCFRQEWKNAKAAACSDSPLYLYGEEGTEVSVKIGTNISNSNAPYNGSFEGVLAGNGKIDIAGNLYESLDFDYINAIKKLPRLDYGKTVRSAGVASVIREYGEKLGLNSKEINDTIISIGQIDSPYVFVSFFSEDASKAILPIAFSPKPDVYRNVVFYLKPVNAPVVADEPEFGNYPKRRGFTAVEVSHMLDN